MAPRDALTWREADGTWNIVEVLSHVADGEITDWMPRVERILAGGGRFTPFDREGGFTRYRGWTAEALVGEFGQLRRANLEKLELRDAAITDEGLLFLAGLSKLTALYIGDKSKVTDQGIDP